jgi:hypothetical protein
MDQRKYKVCTKLPTLISDRREYYFNDLSICSIVSSRERCKELYRSKSAGRGMRPEQMKLAPMRVSEWSWRDLAGSRPAVKMEV